MPVLQSVLQFGIPGGPELLVLAMILILLAVPVAIAVAVLLLVRKGRAPDGDRLEELERRVEELESELDRR